MGNQQSRQGPLKTTRGHVTHDNVPPSNFSKYAFNVRWNPGVMRYIHLIDWSQAKEVLKIPTFPVGSIRRNGSYPPIPKMLFLPHQTPIIRYRHYRHGGECDSISKCLLIDSLNKTMNKKIQSGNFCLSFVC